MALFSKAAKPLDGAGFLRNSLFGNKAPVKPTQSQGAMGTAIFGGYVVEQEKEPYLQGRAKYETFSNALANTAVVAAGVRYFLNIAAGAEWTFEAAETPDGERYAELAEKALTEDPATSWARIVRRSAMYRFYGFSFQEWTAKRHEDGHLTFKDVAPRAQITIERWDVWDDGSVRGVVQRSPQTQEELYLPREKLVYLVDDTLNDSPQGLGLFRHIVESNRRLLRYMQLEGFGFEGDLRGIPVGRAPYGELRKLVEDGEMTEEEAKAAVLPLETFIKKHIKNPELGVLLDSGVFESLDAAASPSPQKKYDLSLLEGSQDSLDDVAKAINRLNLEIARVLGIESLLLGEGSAGSYALARDKTSQFSMTVDATLDELKDAFNNDLLDRLWALNGWPPESKPTMKVATVQFTEIEQMSAAIRDLATAGAVLAPDDPLINHMRALLGLPLLDEDQMALNAALGGAGGEEGDLADGGADDPEVGDLTPQGEVEE